MTRLTWDEIKDAKGVPPRLTEHRLAEIVRHKSVAGNISAQMADELIAEILRLEGQNEIYRVSLGFIEPPASLETVLPPADGTVGMRRGE